jgi:ketosteroid isomerase-like protein
MKRISLIILSLATASLLFSYVTTADEKTGSASAEQTIRQLEEEWANALVKRDYATIDRITASDWMLTDPTGDLQTKAQADADLKSGDLTIESFKINELKVRVYGDTAIVHGLETEKSKYKKEDLSGQYRFTDVFVKRDGRWQAVASHVSRVMKD